MIGKLVVLALIFSSFAYGKEIKILNIINDEDKAVTSVLINVGEDNAIQGFRKLEVLNHSILSNEYFDGSLDYSGVTLLRKKGRDIVILKSLNADAINGGALEIDFLYNGITGTRKQFLIEMDRTSDSWQVTRNGKIIEKLHFISNKKPFVGTVGIKRIAIIK